MSASKAWHTKRRTSCAVNGVSCKGGTLYVTASPCTMCTKQIINAGIARVVAKEYYPDEMGKKMMEESGIIFEIFEKKGNGAL